MAEAKGILGTKLGMTQIFTEDSRAVPVTVIQAGPCVVTQVKTLQRDGYEAIQLAYAEMPRGKANKPQEGHAAAAGTKPHRYLVEMRTDGQAAFEPGHVQLEDHGRADGHADLLEGQAPGTAEEGRKLGELPAEVGELSESVP